MFWKILLKEKGCTCTHVLQYLWKAACAKLTYCECWHGEKGKQICYCVQILTVQCLEGYNAMFKEMFHGSPHSPGQQLNR